MQCTRFGYLIEACYIMVYFGLFQLINIVEEENGALEDESGTDDIPLSPKPGSGTCSPVTMSSGVMTKRGPIVEQVSLKPKMYSCVRWDSGSFC